MGTVSFIGGRVSRAPMHSEFKDRARVALLDKLYATWPDSNWLAVWSDFATYGGFYYAYGILSYVLKSQKKG